MKSLVKVSVFLILSIYKRSFSREGGKRARAPSMVSLSLLRRLAILLRARALDLSTGVFSKFLLHKKMDSFRDFYKVLMKSENSKFLTLNETLKFLCSDEPNWLNLLCIIDDRRARDL